MRLGLVGAGLLAVGMWSAAGAESPDVTVLVKRVGLVSYRPGMKPPPFNARTLGDRHLSLTDLSGKVVVINFWASWCLECRPEMPALEALHRELMPRGLAIIGMNAREDVPTVARYASDLALTFPLLLDPQGKANTAYGVIGLPTTFVVGRNGRAVAFGIGPRDWGSAPARALIEALLAEPAPRAP